jgi:hypothetical protein
VKKNSFLVLGMLALALMFGMSVVACRGKNNGGNGSNERSSGKANFGNYPADYSIAYATMVGFSNAPTVRSLFGPDAYFSTSLQGIPVEVTLESTSGTKEKFTAQLLLTVKVPEKEDVKINRMQVTFESDSMSEMSYIRYVKLVNMDSGKTTEKRSHGDERSDAGLVAFFAGMQGLFWDVSKYKQ